MGKRERQQVAYAVVELQDAQAELRAAVPTPGRRRGRSEDEVETSRDGISLALKLLDDALERLDRNMTTPPGLPVAEAADYLGVSEPTVRAWLKRGLLRKVPRAKPLLVERSSLRSVHGAVTELRERGQDRDWLRALVDLLHDRAEGQRPEVVRGLDELKGRQLEPA